MNTMGIFWLGVMILAAVVEAAVPSLVSVWFVPGGLAALIVSLLGGQLWLQAAVFLAVSAVALALTRPLSKRLLNRRRERTNADRVVGAAGLVTQDIDNVRATGRVSVMGNSWSARSVQPEGRISAGTRVRVHAIEGVKLLVTPEAAPAQEEKER